MTPAALLYPVFAQVALTVVLLMLTGRARVGALRAGKVKIGDVALGQQAWPPGPTQRANAYANQFEIPVLFFAVVAFALITRKADTVMVALAWAFVASRLVHALIHVGSNNVQHRFFAFLVGVALVVAMWVLLAVRVVTEGA